MTLKVEVKLYFFHDMDLVTLYRTKNISFPEITRQVLNAYAEKKAFRVVMTDRLEEKTYNGYRKFIHYRFELDPMHDMSAINLLNKIAYGYRNNFIKTILRQYLCAELPKEYMKDEDDGYFKERSEILQDRRENVQICSERKSPRKNGAKGKKLRQEDKQIKYAESKGNTDSSAKKSKKPPFVPQELVQKQPLEQPIEEVFKKEKHEPQVKEDNAYSLEDDMNDFLGSAIQLF